LLYESEERHRLTLSSAKLAAWDWDIAGGRVSFNERWAEMRGYRLQDIEPHIDTWKNGVHSADMPNLSAQLEAHFAGRTALFEAEYRVLTVSGQWLWLLGRGAIIGHDVKGAPARVACTEIDITERKHMERMKSEFVSTVSHELRTPLTAISGSLGLITGGVLGQLPEQIMQLISIAHKNSLRLSFLINDLLDMEKLEAGKMHFDMLVQPLMPLIEQALEANRPYGAERRVALMLASGLADACVSVDSQRLMQVLSNLLSNAIKYSPQDGRVEIAVEQRDTVVRVTVCDHGPGIPVEFRARIFQKFAQADSSDTRQKGGTGLGLAITRELVERMGGSIGFDSVAGEGAVFYFEFPLSYAPA
jgi:PAS domain S-box-containing protein